MIGQLQKKVFDQFIASLPIRLLPVKNCSFVSVFVCVKDREDLILYFRYINGCELSSSGRSCKNSNSC